MNEYKSLAQIRYKRFNGKNTTINIIKLAKKLPVENLNPKKP